MTPPSPSPQRPPPPSCGLFLQFIVLPFIGFLCVRIFLLTPPLGLTLLVVTSSPGGSYSNWWCSIFNASLSLSVTMTAISTILSTVFLPLNLLIYANLAYSSNIVSELKVSVDKESIDKESIDKEHWRGVLRSATAKALCRLFAYEHPSTRLCAPLLTHVDS